jgi:molybdenum cofactor cytidylyltransferase
MVDGVFAILLAAGESSRMGSLKAMLPWRGVPLIEHQIRCLIDAGVSQVVVVLGHEANLLKPIVESVYGADWVVNSDYLLGKTTSIKAGFKGLTIPRTKQVVLLSVDQPRRSDSVRALLERHTSSYSTITIPTYQGKGGHPIVLSASVLPEVAKIEEETRGLLAVVRRHADETDRFEINDPSLVWDLNTPEQYQQALDASL